jgi:hypothetical protein
VTVYLIHLNEPLKHARHYLGYTDDLVGRILEHGDTTWLRYDEPIILEDGRKCTGEKRGNGAKFMGAVNAAGIHYQLARTWEGEGATRSFERRLKNQKNTWRLCPICNPQSAYRHMRLEDECQLILFPTTIQNANVVETQ